MEFETPSVAAAAVVERGAEAGPLFGRAAAE